MEVINANKNTIRMKSHNSKCEMKETPWILLSTLKNVWKRRKSGVMHDRQTRLRFSSRIHSAQAIFMSSHPFFFFPFSLQSYIPVKLNEQVD